MIPIRLTIEGLYSYQKSQTIDFTVLTDAGLFGIFGPVGSGKSSILEAITFALYGETERMNSRDNRNYNMMNLRSTKASIEFEFLNFENKRYKITRSFRRNSKKFSDVKSGESILYLWENEKWVPQESTDMYAIMGNLSYENFKRTIIIPQGQFKEFLELGAKERTQMLKDIFGLHRFDMQAKAASLYTDTKSQLDHLEGQLLTYEAISEDEISKLQEQFKIDSEAAMKLENTFNEKKEYFLALKNLKEDVESLDKQQKELKVIEEQKPVKDALEQKAILFDSIKLDFENLLLQQSKNLNEYHHKQNEHANENQKLNQIKERADALEIEISSLQTEYFALPQMRLEELDLGLLNQIAILKNKILSTVTRLEKGTALVNSTVTGIEILQTEQVMIQKILEQLKASKPNSALLIAIEKWFVQTEFQKEKMATESEKLTLIQAKLLTLQQSLSDLKIDKTSYQSYFEQENEKIESILQALRLKESNIKVQEQLAQFAHALHDGDPCPLCGSEFHPNILTVDDRHRDQTEINAAIERQHQALKTLAQQKTNAEQLINKLIIAEEAIAQISNDINQTKSDLEVHYENFIWQGFDANDKEGFDIQKSNLEQIELKISVEEKTLTAVFNQIKTEQEKLDKYKTALDDLRNSNTQKEAQITISIGNLKRLKVEDYSQFTPEAIQQILVNKKAQNDELQFTFEQHQKVLNEIKLQIAAQSSSIDAITARTEILKTELQEQQDTIETRLKQHNLENIFAVQSLLDEALDTTIIRKEIQHFRIHHATLQQSIATLLAKTEGKIFNALEFELLVEQVNTLQINLKQCNERLAQLKAEIKRQELEFNKKKELLLVFKRTQARFQDLGLLKRMFDKSGFVEYVSSIYLRQLCDMANVRFHRLTRNQLSLQVNDNNDFEIIDYLNEGKRRSVKTLSGGQGFQVSLSLALALAESVQANAKADKNFFFIDEGFGTQDAASVNIVFETLMNLQKENRIVGIISHVDELKERIPIALSIEKDEESGSVIRQL